MKTIYVVEYGSGGIERCRSKANLAHFIACAVESGYRTFNVSIVKEKRRARK